MASLQGTTVNNFLRTLEQVRATGWYGVPTGSSYTGLATEMGVSSGQGYILCYNRDSSSYGVLNLQGSSSNLQISGSNVNVTSGALQQGGNQVLHAGNVATYALPIGGGTMTGVLTTYTPGVQTSLSGLSAFNAGVNVGERSVGSAAGFVPGYGQTTVYTLGYRSHMILGSYRTASSWGGGPFIAWGGNDSNATEYWLFNQGGAITHSSGTTFLNNNSSLTAGNLSGTIPSAVLGNSAHFIGTTSIALNRASASQTLTGISIDGNAANVTGTVVIGNGGTGATTAANARTNLGATTVGANLFTLTNPSAITFPRINADNTVSALDAATFRTAIGAGTGSGNGTVTSVGGTGTVSGLTLSGTVTTTGNLTLGGTLSVTASNFASQTANTFLSAPNGAAGVPTFRAIVAADVPTLNQNTTGSSGSCTGNAATATNLSTNRTNWSTNGTITAVVGQLSWKHYGNSHTIFDASNSTNPNGGAVNNTNSAIAWSATYPTLMGWNGASTYGVRVDSCRLADSATSATTATGNAGSVTYLPNRTDSAAYPVVWGAAYTNGTGTIAYSCAAVTIQSSTGTLFASTFSGSGASLTSLPAGNLTGTIPSAVLGNSSHFIGTTSITLNRASASQSLTGVNIDGSSGSCTGNAANATTAGGLAVHTGTNNEANKIVRTQANGYIMAGWINTISGDNGTTAIDRVYASSDGYIRYYTPANFRTVLDVPTRAGSGASGTWGININGSAATANALNTGNTYTIAGLTSNGTINIFPPFSGGYSYFLRMGYDNSGNYDYTVKRNGTTGFLEFNGTQTGFIGYVFSSGNLGVGTSPSSYKLDVNGPCHATSFPTSSDARFKKNVKPLKNCVDKVKKMQGVSYEWNEFVNHRRDGYSLNTAVLGVIAQDLEKILPEVVSKWHLSDDCEDARAVDYIRIIPVLIEAIKEQQIELDDLKNRLIRLENK